MRIAGSSLANPYAAISAGIGSLWGKQHGGASEECVNMYKSIGSIENVPAFIEKCKKKEVKLWGFGHRVFKAYDPRALIFKQMIFDFNKQIGTEIDNLT